MELSARFITDRHLPDKAIDVIDEAGAAQRILPKSRQKKLIGKPEIEEIMAKIARIPSTHVSNDDRTVLKNLERDLKATVFGQDQAIDALAKAIKMARSGLGNPGKPIGAFLFSGPTGVGKTEVAKHWLLQGIDSACRYVRIHGAQRRLPAYWGASRYVGFDKGGLLRSVTRSPICVLLLTKSKRPIRKSTTYVAVMDNGTLTDNNGRKADFRNVVIIMTTNAGAADLQKPVMGFTNAKETGDELVEIKRLFSPEFRNRLDGVISFRPLDHDIILRVVDKFLMQLEEQLHEKKVEAIFTDALKDMLAERGFDPLWGPAMARLSRTPYGQPGGRAPVGRLLHGVRYVEWMKRIR